MYCPALLIWRSVRDVRPRHNGTFSIPNSTSQADGDAKIDVKLRLRAEYRQKILGKWQRIARDTFDINLTATGKVKVRVTIAATDRRGAIQKTYIGFRVKIRDMLGGNYSTRALQVHPCLKFPSRIRDRFGEVPKMSIELHPSVAVTEDGRVQIKVRLATDLDGYAHDWNVQQLDADGCEIKLAGYHILSYCSLVEPEIRKRLDRYLDRWTAVESPKGPSINDITHWRGEGVVQIQIVCMNRPVTGGGVQKCEQNLRDIIYG